MARNLTARLRLVRGVKKKKSTTVRDLPSPGDGWERAGTFCYVNETQWPVPESLCSYLRDLSSSLLFRHHQDVPEIGELLFFDLETTGLSTGPGTAVFLAGFGRIRGNTLLLTRFFMSDYPGEAEFLALVRDFLPPNPYWISYNGKCFDAPMLITKGLMHGIMFPFSRHGDMLHLSRRLWKRILPSCSLSSIEKNILGITRVDDVPGSQVPDIYFGYLRTGQTDSLSGVAAHHLQDILTLAELFGHFIQLGRDPLSAAGTDPCGLGMLLRNEPAGREILTRGFIEGDMRCGIILAAISKKERNYDRAAEIWTSLAEKWLSPWAAVELAKYYEHCIKDLNKALFWTVESRNLSTVHPLRDDSEKRQKRLEERIKARLFPQVPRKD